MAAAAYLARPGFERLLVEAHERVERLGRVGGTVRLERLSAEEASELAGLPRTVGRGRPRAGQDFNCDLRRLDAALRATAFGLGLREALELACGPVGSLPARRAAEAERRATFWRRVLAHPLCVQDPRVGEWVEGLRARGSLRREGESALERALDLGAHLPASPPVERTRLAAEVVNGNPHALDDAEPLAALVLRQLAARADEPVPTAASERRLLWRRFGVVSDTASADVLTLGLTPYPDGPLARALTVMSGRHFRITLGQLDQERLRFPLGGRVFTCENPTVLLAAETRLWPSPPPMVCTSGWPNSAVVALIQRLRHHGAEMVHHGDFDWKGLEIGRFLRERLGVGRWRFDDAAYREGVERHAARTRPLAGAAPARRGEDAELVGAMGDAGRELHEETVLDELLADLEDGRGRRRTFADE